MERESAAEIQEAESNKTVVAQQMTAEVQKGITDVRSSLAKIKTTEVTVQQAQTALKLADIRYEAGTTTNLDLLDVETALAQARLDRLQALYNYVLGRYELRQAIGKDPL